MISSKVDMPSRSEEANARLIDPTIDALIENRAAMGKSGRDNDGTIHVRELAIPPSDLWNPEFRSFYAKRGMRTVDPAVTRVPAKTAPQAEWDRYDRLIDEQFNNEPLAQALDRYAVAVVDTQIAGVRAGAISPKGGCTPENQHRVLLHLHGGGFVLNRGLV